MDLNLEYVLTISSSQQTLVEWLRMFCSVIREGTPFQKGSQVFRILTKDYKDKLFVICVLTCINFHHNSSNVPKQSK